MEEPDREIRPCQRCPFHAFDGNDLCDTCLREDDEQTFHVGANLEDMRVLQKESNRRRSKILDLLEERN